MLFAYRVLNLEKYEIELRKLIQAYLKLNVNVNGQNDGYKWAYPYPNLNVNVNIINIHIRIRRTLEADNRFILESESERECERQYNLTCT